MEQLTLLHEAQKVADYLVVVEPGQEIRKQLAGIQNWFCDRYHLSPNHRVRPHITLMGFHAVQHSDQKLAEFLKEALMRTQGQSVLVENFGIAYPNSVHLQVANFEELNSIVHELKMQMYYQHISPLKQVYFPPDPQLMILKNIAEWQMNMIQGEIDKCRYQNVFAIESLVLLKRESRDQAYTRVAEISRTKSKSLKKAC